MIKFEVLCASSLQENLINNNNDDDDNFHEQFSISETPLYVVHSINQAPASCLIYNYQTVVVRFRIAYNVWIMIENRSTDGLPLSNKTTEVF